MATFDPLEQRLCVRVVYDGTAGTGKTTNLRQLAALFATQRATEVHTPSEVDGRTLYFDWMQIAAGVVSGIPLLCQIISVPGQVVLTPRRRHLLATADVVVYVCDSSAAAVQRAAAGLAVLDDVARERGEPVPLVIQANKQDQLDALEAPRLLRALERDGVPSIDAIATDGVGVVDTFVTAIRTLSRSIEERAERGELRLEVRPAETRERALASVAAQRIDPEWAAEMLLEEASAAFLFEQTAAVVQTDSDTIKRAWALPTLPHADVPTGFIWPAHTGRRTLGTLAATGALSGRPSTDASGAVSYAARGYVLDTHASRRFATEELARQALVRAARERTQLEHLLVPATVVVAQSAEDGAWWIWTVMPQIASLEHTLRAVASDGERARSLLDAYGVALADAVRVSLRFGFGLQLAAGSFGVEGDILRYVGDIGPPGRPDDVASQVAGAIAAVEDVGVERGVVLAAFERALQRRLEQEELAAVGSAAARVHAMLTRGG
jgi:hypothetical protein